jgi:hypothetical protein
MTGAIIPVDGGATAITSSSFGVDAAAATVEFLAKK